MTILELRDDEHLESLLKKFDRLLPNGYDISEEGSDIIVSTNGKVRFKLTKKKEKENKKNRLLL